jgi:hypothetical protein
VDNATLMFKRLRNHFATKPKRDPEYLARVRLLPCCVCGSEPSEPHHIGQSYGPLKTSDYFTIPVCRTHHEDFHRNSHLSETQARMMEFVIITLARYAGENK